MATNEGWPEAFGFSIAGGDPCIISKVEDGGSAQEAGLQARSGVFRNLSCSRATIPFCRLVTC